jgi:DNA polymerase-4/protein ImuB
VVWEAILDDLEIVAPQVEDEGPGGGYLNVAGLNAHYRDERELGRRISDAVRDASGLDASVGIAGSKFTARAAAVTTSASEQTVVPAGEEASFLAHSSTNLLPVDAETISRLHLLGLDLIGDIASFTVPELQSQFGVEGERLWRLCHGTDNEPLRARGHVEVLSEELSFESSVAGIDVMIAAARQLFSRLRGPLHGRATRELVLAAELVSGRGWERRFVLREAISEDERLVYVLKTGLSNFPPPTAIKSLSLSLRGITGETGKQLALGDRGRLEHELEEVIRQLKARYGHSPIFRCVDVEPWSVIPEARQILVESDV